MATQAESWQQAAGGYGQQAPRSLSHAGDPRQASDHPALALGQAWEPVAHRFFARKSRWSATNSPSIGDPREYRFCRGSARSVALALESQVSVGRASVSTIASRQLSLAEGGSGMSCPDHPAGSAERSCMNGKARKTRHSTGDLI